MSHRTGEQEGACLLPQIVNHHLLACNHPTHHAKSLAQRSFDDGQPVHQPFAFGDAAATRSVKPDGVHLVEVGHCVVLVSKVADFRNRRDVAIHRIDAFKGDQLRLPERKRGQLGFEILQVET